MSQFDFGTIDPDTKSGVALAGDLNSWRTALNSGHKGPAAPAYAIAGLRWLDDTASPIWTLKIYDGAQWIGLVTINTTTNMAWPVSVGEKQNFPLAAGTANALTLTPALPLAAYTDLDVVTLEAAADVTTAATLNVSGLGTKAIRKMFGGADVALVAGDMLDGGRYILNYDTAANAAAGAWILVNPAVAASSAVGERLSYQLAGGSANALTLTPASPMTAYAARDVITAEAASNVSGAATLNVSGVGIKAIRKIVLGVDVAVAAGDIVDGGRYVFVYDTAANAAAGGWIVVNPSVSVLGRREKWFDAAEGVPHATAGPQAGIRFMPTDGSAVFYYAFDAVVSETLYFRWLPPKGYDGAGITAQARWTAASGSGTVTFDFNVGGVGNGESLDIAGAGGAAVGTTDTFLGANLEHDTPETGAIAITPAFADGDFVVVKVARNMADSLAVDAQLLGFKIFYNVDQGNDA